MTQVLSVRLEDELIDRVKSQTVSPRQVVTEALLQYFRYKEKWAPEENGEIKDVHISKHLPNQTVMLQTDAEFSKLEMEIEFLKAKLDDKQELLSDKNLLIEDLQKDKRYLQTQLHIMRVHFMPAKIGFFAGLLPSGKKAIKVREELDDLEREFIKPEKN